MLTLSMIQTILEVFADFFEVLAIITFCHWGEYRSSWGWGDLMSTLDNDPRQHPFNVISLLNSEHVDGPGGF